MSSPVNGSNKVDEEVNEDYSFIGIVEKEAHSRWSSENTQKGNKKNQQDEESDAINEEGVISFHRNGMKEKVYYTAQDCEPRSTPRVGDKVCTIPFESEKKKHESVFLYLLLLKIMETKLKQETNHFHDSIYSLEVHMGFQLDFTYDN